MHLLKTDWIHFLIFTTQFCWRSTSECCLHWLAEWPHCHAFCLLLTDILITAVNAAPGCVPFRHYPRLPKGVSWGDVSTSPDHHTLTTFPGPMASLPSCAQGSFVVMPGNGSLPPNHPEIPQTPFTRGRLQWGVEHDCLILSEGQKSGKLRSCLVLLFAPCVSLHVGFSLVANFGLSRHFLLNMRSRGSELDLKISRKWDLHLWTR